jgi:hypothetical protein
MQSSANSNRASLKVRVVLAEQNASWIIGKMASRLVDELGRLGVTATLAADADDTADINHWMSYAVVTRRAGRASTFFITHIDDPYKTASVAHLLRERADLGLCMSRDMMRTLVAGGIPQDRLWYVLPAFDPPAEPRRIRIAITTRLYPDGRKREDLLVRLAAERDLSSFHFEIAGSGWDEVVPLLRAAGATVQWSPGSEDYQADYRELLESMRSCDYYLYLGMDEGSLGTLDALALGLGTIVTPQGFHLDLPITEPVESYEDVAAVFDRLARERAARMQAVHGWTWEQYAREHIHVWEALLDGKRAELPSLLAGVGRYADAAPLTVPGLSRRTWSTYYGRMFSPRRLVDGLAMLRKALRRS